MISRSALTEPIILLHFFFFPIMDFPLYFAPKSADSFFFPRLFSAGMSATTGNPKSPKMLISFD